MRYAGLATLAICAMSTPVMADAQTADPCVYPQGPANVLGQIFQPIQEQQRVQACQQYRAAQIRQQQDAYFAQQAAQARQLAEQEDADRQQVAAQHAQEVALQRERTAAARHDQLEAVAEQEAENSPANVCARPDTARELMTEYNAMSWPSLAERRVIDIEHLVTIKNDPNNRFLSCHGVWVHTMGAKIEGTMTMHPNVAGDIIYSWRQEFWQPPVPLQPDLPAPSPGREQSATAESPVAFQQGLADRSSWEAWILTTSGAYHDGALYWAAHRSLANNGGCGGLAGDAGAGCVEASNRLAPFDRRRKTEPEYRLGWNSYPE